MEMDIQLLTRFERELIPHDLSRSSVPAKIIGFGEISAIFQIGEDPDIIYKRLPLFPDIQTAEAYRKMYFEYCALLRQAGINLPWDDAVIIELPDRPVVIYFAQQRFDASLFCHHLIHTLDEPEREAMLIQILTALTGIWGLIKITHPGLKLRLTASFQIGCGAMKMVHKNYTWWIPQPLLFGKTELSNWMSACFCKVHLLTSAG